MYDEDNIDKYDHVKYYLELDAVAFPPPMDININMMPFIVEPNFPTIPEVFVLSSYMLSVCVTALL
jgi:hypothetical protein